MSNETLQELSNWHIAKFVASMRLSARVQIQTTNVEIAKALNAIKTQEHPNQPAQITANLLKDWGSEKKLTNRVIDKTDLEAMLKYFFSNKLHPTTPEGWDGLITVHKYVKSNNNDIPEYLKSGLTGMRG